MHKNGKTKNMQNSDKQIEYAKQSVMQLFTDNFGRPKKTPYHIAQLQTLLENKHFQWVTYQAAVQLLKEGSLTRIESETKTQEKVVFLYNAKLNQPKFATQLNKHIKAHCKLIDKYSDSKVCEILGKYLEGLVKTELRVQGFKILDTHSRIYKNKEWTQTGHNLDFIAEHEVGKLVIGVEVKNTIPIIKRDEIEAKLAMCAFLGITPVFAVRWLKPYAELIRSRGGFSWMFKTQIYPPGFEDLTKTLYNRLSLPVTVRTDLPEKSVEIFHKWVQNQSMQHQNNQR